MQNISSAASNTYLIKRFNIPLQPLLVNYRSNQAIVDYAPLASTTAGSYKQVVNPVEGSYECVSRA